MLTYCAAAASFFAAAVATANASGAPMTNQSIVIFAFGDSLTAGYGLPPKDAFPVKLQAALRAKGYNVEILNGGVSGDTTQNGVTRLEWSLPSHADAAIVEFGANDAFQGVPPATVKSNLKTIVERLKAHGLQIMLSGMMAPRNLGAGYYEAFDRIYSEIASQYNCVLYPFYLDGVIMDAKLNQPDMIHPNAAGVDVIVQRITPTVAKLVDRVLQDRKAHGQHSSD
jgi:acyl-CoA thioesterase-1